MCPRCGGELASAARHRAEMRAVARRQARRYVAGGAGIVLLVLAAIAWLLFGPGVAHADGKPPAPPPSGGSASTPPKKPKKDKVAAALPPRAGDGSKAQKADLDAATSPRSVRVHLLDGSVVIGTVHAEEAGALIVDCSLGQLAIPRVRISTIAYDAAAGVGQKRAPVQELDDEDKPTQRHSATLAPVGGRSPPDSGGCGSETPRHPLHALAISVNCDRYASC